MHFRMTTAGRLSMVTAEWFIDNAALLIRELVACERREDGTFAYASRRRSTIRFAIDNIDRALHLMTHGIGSGVSMQPRDVLGPVTSTQVVRREFDRLLDEAASQLAEDRTHAGLQHARDLLGRAVAAMTRPVHIGGPHN